MLGVLLISHGNMAEGMVDSLSMFFGKDIKQLDFLSLKPEMGADEFGEKLREKVNDLNDGDGVLIMADMLGGTPCNRALQVINENVDLIVGMNLPTAMELLAAREAGKVDVANLVESAKNSFIDAKAMFMNTNSDDVDDD